MVKSKSVIDSINEPSIPTLTPSAANITLENIDELTNPFAY